MACAAFESMGTADRLLHDIRSDMYRPRLNWLGLWQRSPVCEYLDCVSTAIRRQSIPSQRNHCKTHGTRWSLRQFLQAETVSSRPHGIISEFPSMYVEIHVGAGFSPRQCLASNDTTLRGIFAEIHTLDAWRPLGHRAMAMLYKCIHLKC